MPINGAAMLGAEMRYVLAATCLLTTSVAHAEDRRLNSQIFFFTAWCSGYDMVYRWRINKQPGGKNVVPKPAEYGKSFLYPWLNTDIMIRGVEVTLTSPSTWQSVVSLPARYRSLMVGNNASGDIMLSVPAGKSYGVNFFPKDVGFYFPGIAKKTPLTYIDIHASCWPGGHADIALNIYYTVTEPGPPQVAQDN